MRDFTKTLRNSLSNLTIEEQLTFSLTRREAKRSLSTAGGRRHCRHKQRRKLLIKHFWWGGAAMYFIFVLIKLEGEQLFFFFISQHFIFKPKLKSVSRLAIIVSLFSARVFLENPHNLSQRTTKHCALCIF